MKRAIRDFEAWVDGIARAGEEETNVHRKAILRNYLHHVCLEFHGRYEEFLGPDMAVDKPVYVVKLEAKTGTSDAVVCDGYDEVLAFYRALNEFSLITNQDERLAVGDWGFASYNTIVLWTRGIHVTNLLNIAGCDPAGFYKVSRPIAMFWNYSPDAKLIGEEVYEVAPPVVELIDELEFPTEEEIRAVASKYLPTGKLRAKT